LSGAGSSFNADHAWALAPEVSLRHEPFGALAYHFGTRRLSFLKTRMLVAVVVRLDAAPTARAAIRAASVHERDEPSYERALARLAETGMIVEKGIA
jgi:putative mycofactocin binding protein MftB